jgi:hypothetical protein
MRHALNLNPDHNTAIRAEIGERLGFFSQKNSLDHHRAFSICLIA